MQSLTKIILALVITAMVAVGGGAYLWQNQNDAPSEVAPQVASTKPVIISPVNGSNVLGPQIVVTGKTGPNFVIWTYINTPASERLGANSYANGGSSEADANGNFSFSLAEPCSHDLTIIVAAMDEKDMRNEFWNAENLSEPVSFTTTGALPGVCSQ